MNKNLILVAISLLFFTSSVTALGISPGRNTLAFTPSMSGQGAFNIVNSEGKDMLVSVIAQGDLASYIKINARRVNIKADTEKELYTYSYDFPESLPPGLNTAEIIITEIPDQATGSETYVGATIAVAHQIYVNVPYPGKYAEADIDVVSKNSGQETLFMIPVMSLGKFDLTSVRANIDVYNADGLLVYSFNTEPISIKSGERGEIQYLWDTSNVGIGEYLADVTVIYDGETISLKKRFTIGDEVLELQQIYVNDFSLGEIVKMEMLVQNNWNKIITDAYSRTKIYDDSGKVLADFNSANYDIDASSKKVIVSYWDTAGVQEGTYDTTVSLEYSDDSIENNLQLVVKENDLQVIGLGYVISSGGDIKSSGGGSTTLIIIVIILILVNLLWFFVLRKYLAKNKS